MSYKGHSICHLIWNENNKWKVCESCDMKLLARKFVTKSEL